MARPAWALACSSVLENMGDLVRDRLETRCVVCEGNDVPAGGGDSVVIGKLVASTCSCSHVAQVVIKRTFQVRPER